MQMIVKCNLRSLFTAPEHIDGNFAKYGIFLIFVKKYPQDPSTSFSTSIPFPTDHHSTLSPFRAWAVCGNERAVTDVAVETRLKRLGGGDSADGTWVGSVSGRTE
jgi:hypothetical protein